jgi:enamine deaminase RidA (YjgF/YER057c/UK114 family)
MTLHKANAASQKLTKPLATYAHTRVVGDLVFIAGQGCRDPETDLWDGVTFDASGAVVSIDFEAQVRGVLRNIERALESLSITKNALVDIQVFLTDMTQQFPHLNKVWNEFFAGVPHPPTRTTVAVKELPGFNLVEMKAIAARK